MKTESLQELIGLDSTDKLIDVKMSVDDTKSSPNELLAQLSNIIKADKSDLLNDFVDY